MLAGRSRRLRFAAALCLLVALVLGLHRAVQVDGWLRPVVVVGPSMQPTLWGPSKQLPCSRCGVAIRFHTLTAPPDTVRCWNCGLAQPADRAIDLPGDRVSIDRAAYRWRLLGLTLRQSTPQRGDLVAVAPSFPPSFPPNANRPANVTARGSATALGHPTSALQVKRILAVPGDQLSLQGNELLINGRCVHDHLPAPPGGITVHTQTLPLKTLTLNVPPQADAATDLSPDAADPWLRWRWQRATADEKTTVEDWLVYHHVSVHDQRAAPICDDYPGNVDVVRRMNPIERFQVTLDLELPRDSAVKIVCWQADGPRCYAASFATGRHHIEVGPQRQHPPGRWRQVACAANPPVDAQRPIAITGLRSTAAAVQLTVTRHLHWFIDAKHRSHWETTPITLAPGHYFIAGDNQPISIDSRESPDGIDSQQIVGKVTAW